MSALRQFDLHQLVVCERLVGVDEAGRGCLAGPVVAGAVCLDGDFFQSSWCQLRAGEVDDSKKLEADKREEIYEEIQALKLSGCLHAETGLATVDEINSHNILGATRLAMQRALEAVAKVAENLKLPGFESDSPLFDNEKKADFTNTSSQVAAILIDGRRLNPFPYQHKAIVKGDGKSLAIALASILAKVTRDKLMVELDRRYPGYGFARHKGYGTPEHCSAILRTGPTAEHRPLFFTKYFCPRIRSGANRPSSGSR